MSKVQVTVTCSTSVDNLSVDMSVYELHKEAIHLYMAGVNLEYQTPSSATFGELGWYQVDDNFNALLKHEYITFRKVSPKPVQGEVWERKGKPYLVVTVNHRDRMVDLMPLDSKDTEFLVECWGCLKYGAKSVELYYILKHMLGNSEYLDDEDASRLAGVLNNISLIAQAGMENRVHNLLNSMENNTQALAKKAKESL